MNRTFRFVEPLKCSIDIKNLYLEPAEMVRPYAVAYM